MTSIVNIDEEIAKMIFEEEKKRAPPKAQKSAEAYEKYCKQMFAKEQNQDEKIKKQNEKKEKQNEKKEKQQPQKKWWSSFFKMTPIRRNISIENLSTNDLRENLLFSQNHV